MRDGFIKHLISALGGRDTTTYTVDEDMTRDIIRSHTRLYQWLRALKLLVDGSLMAVKLR